MKLNHTIALIAGLAVLSLAALPQAASAQGVLFVKGNMVGIGVDPPLDLLHVKSTVAGAKNMLRLTNNGAPFAQYEDTALGVSWGLQPTGGGTFTITKLGTGGAELAIKQNGEVKMGPGGVTKFTLSPTGNLTITGTLTQGSSRELKDGFAPIDGREALRRATSLDVLEWSYKGEQTRHLGPMAEDFHSAFGLGSDAKGLAPGDLAGVTLIALQGLNQVVEEKDQEIAQLRNELAELRGMVEALAAQ